MKTVKGHFHIKFDEELHDIIIESINTTSKMISESEWHDIKNIKLYDNGLVVITATITIEDE